MRYITRELHDSIQTDVSRDEWRDAVRRWRAAFEACEAELSTIKPSLPPGMRSFAGVTLHDGVVKSAGQPRCGCVELMVDATGNPCGPNGLHRIEFQGVREVEGLADMVGDEWLYEEVHLHPSAGFEYCILLRNTEFRVVADELIVERLTTTGQTERDSYNFYRLGTESIKTGAFATAREQLLKSLELMPHPKTCERLAFVLEQLGQVPAANEMIERAFELGPNNDHVASRYANMHFLSGNLEKARDVLAGILERNSTYGPAKRLMDELKRQMP